MIIFKPLVTSLATLIFGGVSAQAAEWLNLPAKPGTYNGKSIVLIAGDEEYRSEESCPMLAKILSQRQVGVVVQDDDVAQGRREAADRVQGAVRLRPAGGADAGRCGAHQGVH